MNRIELYIDKENKLCLDFYYYTDDDYPISKFKGEKCYSVISKLCELPILNIIDNQKTKEVSLIFKECMLNISEYDQVLKKRGTGPIKVSLSKYYESEKKKTFKPRKVKRVNKHVNAEIIAGVLALSVFGTIVINQFSNKKHSDYSTPTMPTTTYETEPTIADIKDISIGEEIPSSTVIDEYAEQEVLNEFNEITSIDVSGVNENSINVSISYEDRSDQEKGRITKSYYGEIIEKYAKMYGLDSKIVLAIATQERGIHSTERDPGGATGLMQLQNAVWVGNNITAYNYDLGEYETVTVDEKSISDLFQNIKIGCMYFQNCMDYMNNNVLAAIQCYNYGYGNMQTVLGEYSVQTGKTKKEILNDITDYGWMEYRTSIPRNEGDSIYIEHVLSWIGSEVNISNGMLNNVPVNLTITNSSPIKQR